MSKVKLVKKDEEEEELDELELEEIDLGELRTLIPTFNDVVDVVTAALGIHYMDKLMAYVPEFAGKWTKLIVSYLIYKLGPKIHRAVQMAGFGMLARSVEELIAPYLPGSPSVFKANSKTASEDAYSLALKYAYGYSYGGGPRA
ncbi:MAG: hypothetical protein QXT64_02435 [Desulfurococcaceae archaeon]